MKKSFALRVLALCFFLLALPLLIDTFIFFKNSNTVAIKKLKGDLEEEGIIRTFSLEEKLSIDSYLIESLIYILEKESQKKDFSGERLNEILQNFKKITPNYNFFVTELTNKSAANKIIGASDPAKVGTFFTTTYCVNELINGKELNFIKRLYVSKEKAWKPFILAGRMIHLKPNQEALFIIYSDISDFLNKILEPSLDNEYFAFVQHEGFVIVASDKNLEGNIFPFLAEDPEEWKRMPPDRLGDVHLADKPLKIAQDTPPPFFEFFFNNEVQLGYFRKIPICGSYLVAYTQKNTLFAEEIKSFLFFYCFYGVVLILGGGITYWFTVWLSRPLQQLETVMNQVGENNLQVRFKPTPLGYEINFLGEVFNITLDSLLDNMEKLEDLKIEKETIRREISIGKEVQNRLIPPTTLITEDIEIEGRYKSVLKVGGDFHDYSILKDKDKISLVVADSSGQGISSCLYALSLRSLLRSNLTVGNNIQEILKATNNGFLDLAGDTGMFVTLLMGIYNRETALLEYYSCGHPPGIVLRGNEIIELEHRGLAMGLLEVSDLEISNIQLQKGDFLIFFTDGLTSAMNPKGIIFGRKRLYKSLKSQKWGTAKELVNGLLQIVDEFTAKQEANNELTILVMKIK